MKTLFVSLDVPFPPDKGQRMRNWSILRALAAEGHDVSLISFGADAIVSQQTHDALNAVCSEVVLLPTSTGRLPAWRAHLHRLRGVMSPTPYGAWRFRSTALVDAVRDHLARHSCDVVIWDEAYNLENLITPLPVPVVLNSHDVMQVIWQRYLDLERHPVKRLYAWLEYQKLRRWEAGAHRRVKKVLAVSAHDASVLRSLCPGLDVDVVPNTIDPSQYEPAPSDDGVTVLFVGGMDWFPNLDAARFFIQDVFPAVNAAMPAARFVVAGRSPSASVREQLEIPGVTFLGRVPDIRSAIDQAAVCVVPLRIGSGVRWKILEAAAMGKAMVSTVLGAEGLDFADGEEIVLADAPRDFARAVVELLKDAPRRQALGRAARHRVERQYSTAVLRSALNDALAEFQPTHLVNQR